jgi:L-threonylcarbamoyladenylate synthase
MTKVYKVDPNDPNEEILKEVARMVKDGKLVAFPTETVYGLGTNAFNENAVKKIFEVKQRPPKPVAVIVPNLNVVREIAKPNEVALKLMKSFLPGPVTIIVKKRDVIPDIVTAGSDKVGIRIPNYKIPIKIAEFSGVPIATPSANISGKPSPTKAEHVVQDLMGKVDAIVDGGETPLKIESTVIDTTTDPPKVLRIGALPLKEIERVIGKVEVLDYRAYKPKAKVVAIFGKYNVEEIARRFKGRVCIVKRDELEDFLDVLRRCEGCDVIIFECYNVEEAIGNRIRTIADLIFE